MAATYKLKCKNCGTYFYPEHGNNTHCQKCKLQNNNPNGYNKHKKNPNPKPKEKKLAEILTLELVQEAYRDMKRKEAQYKGASSYYGRVHRQFLGLDKIDEIIKEKEGKQK